ncbi:NmrA/HSCARG family protein [Williamsia phyllosphaerae]|uniref:NmrA family transcriptional regulator n=1 Tax=Williamsia phyllosphaerae TaxID=885042 RepID=A0ABQ1UJY8_9NOCA|nr:NmrA/HSCARG family protein [Williamsia phyllosphaerae]GGF20824.1 NmrA family transcriptional regulator [Williamsia phyllosphaerae]
MTDHHSNRPILPGENVIVVLGATGQQGGSVASALNADGWRVRAVVRDPSSAPARQLKATGIETIAGDLADPTSLRSAFVGAYGVFSVQPSSGQANTEMSDDDEVAWGVLVADLAGEAGVEHLVYSSAIAAGSTPTGIGHFDTKSRIEAHVRGLDIASTIIRPASFMEILLLPGMGLADGVFTFLMRKDQAVQVLAVRDIGLVVAEIFGSPSSFVDRTIDLAGDSLTGDELAHHLGTALDRPVSYRRIPDDVLRGNDLLGRLAAAVDDGRLAGHADLTALRQTFPFLLRFDEWLAGLDAQTLAAATQSSTGGVALR